MYTDALKKTLHAICTSSFSVFELIHEKASGGFWIWEPETDQFWINPALAGRIGYAKNGSEKGFSGIIESTEAKKLKTKAEKLGHEAEFESVVSYSGLNEYRTTLPCRLICIEKNDKKWLIGAHEIISPVKDEPHQQHYLSDYLINLHEILFTLDKDQRHTGVYGKWIEQTGMKPEDFLGKTSAEILGEEAAKPHFKANQKALKGETVSYTWRVEAPDGLHYYRTNLSPVTDNEGNITGIIGLGVDISSEKENEILLNEAQKTLQFGSWSFDFRNNHLTWSEGLYDVFDVDRNTFKETHGSFLSLINEEDKERALQTSKRTQETGEPFHIRYGITTLSGENRIIEEFGFAEKDEDGKIVRLYGTAQNITELSKLQSDSKNAERIFEYSTEMLCTTGFDGYFKAINPAWSKTLGWSEEELLAKPYINFVHPDDRELTIEEGTKVLKGEGSVNFENRYICKDGSHKTLRWNSYIFPEEEVIYAVVSDVTEKRKIEQQLEHSHELMRYVVEHANSAVAIFDKDLHFIYVSDRFKKEFQVEDQEVIGRHHYDVFPDLPQKFRNIHQRVLKGEVLSADADEYVREDGSVHYTRWECRPWYDAKGEVGGIILYNAVITKEIERELELKKLHTAVEQSPSSIVITDVTGLIEYVNPVFTKLTGYTLEEARQTTPKILKSGKQPKEFYKELWNTITSGKVWRGELYNVKKNGEYYWERATISPVFDDEGTITNYLAVKDDITGRKKIEAELERFKTISDSGLYGKAITDYEGNLIYVNRFFANIHGYEPEELEGKHLAVFYAEDQLPHVGNLIDELKKNEGFESKLVWHVHRNGTPFPMLMSAIVIHDEHSSSSYLATTAIDITEYLKTQNLLAESRKQLTVLSDNLPDGFVYQINTGIGGSKQEFTYVSAGIERLVGVSPKEIMLNPAVIYKTFLEEDAAMLAAEEEKALRANSTLTAEVRYKDAAGNVRWLLVTSSPRENENGETIWDGIGLDITKLKSAERQLSETEVRLKTLSDNLSDGFVYEINTGTDDSIRKLNYASAGIEKMFGVTVEDAMNDLSLIYGKFFKDDAIKHAKKEAECFKTMSSLSTELRYYGPSGETRWMLAYSSPRRNAKGEVLWHGVAMDITKQKEVENEIRVSQQKFKIVSENTFHWEFWEREDGSFIYNSPSCERITGYSVADFENDPELLLKIMHPEDREHYKKHRRKTWKVHKADSCNFRIFHKNGELKYIEHVCQPAFDDNSTFTGIRGTNIDVTRRKEFESRLIESEKRFREIFETLPVISVQGYNRNREVIYWNHASEELYGYTAEEAMGRQLEDLIIPDKMRNQVISDIRNWIEKGVAIPSSELTLRKKDGSSVFVYSNHVLLENLKGEPEMFCIDIDLTELKQKELKLQETQERYRSIIAVSNTGAWEFNRKTGYLWVSPEYLTMLGYDPSEFEENKGHLEHFWLKRLHPKDKERAVSVFSDYLSGNMDGYYENYFRLKHKDGSDVWIRSKGKNLKNPDGSASDLILGTHIDITELQEKTEKIEESELYHRSLVLTIPDMIFVINSDGVFLDYNSSDEALLYTKPDEFLGKKVGEVLSPEIAQKQLAAIRESLETNQTVSFEYELKMGDVSRYFSAKTSGLSKDRVITTVRDVTAYQESLNQIRSLLDVREKQNSSLREFTHIVSHNLRNHTANMLGLFMIMEEDEPDLLKSDLIQMLKKSTDGLEQSIQDLNHILNLKTDTELKLQKINLHETVNKLFRETGGYAEKKDVELINEIPDDFLVKSEPGYLENSLMSLISNGIKYSSPERKSWVRVTADNLKGLTQISVEDNGVGIDTEKHGESIFGMYKKLQHSDSKGLGLFLAKNLVISLGGNITLESEPEKGSMFSITLPDHILKEEVTGDSFE